MIISRDVTRIIHFCLDQLLPPALRDSSWLMKPLMKLALGKKAAYFLDFKDKAHTLTEEEFAAIYRETSGILGRETDLNKKCIETILSESLTGDILEAGCGTGYLCRLIAQKNPSARIAGIDINPPQNGAANLSFMAGSVENIPYPDKSFDTVICTHTLEHVRDLPRALSELRRIVRRKLVIVVPRQRPYRFTFDLHLHFFPLLSDILFRFQPAKDVNHTCKELDGDWYYTETHKSP